jgi:hypothetical protein
MNSQGQASPRRRQLNARVRDGNSFYKLLSSLKGEKSTDINKLYWLVQKGMYFTCSLISMKITLELKRITPAIKNMIFKQLRYSNLFFKSLNQLPQQILQKHSPEYPLSRS